MTTERFSLDSNVLVYAADGRAGARHARALQIIVLAARQDCVLTLQALGEFFHATTRKRIAPRHDAAAQVRDLLAIFPTAAPDADALRTALDEAERGTRSFWEGLLIATAARAGCVFLLSEDMQDGARLGGVTVLDPFVGDELPEAVAQLLR
jgi:predicted nucleic acid-binding protein